VLVELSVMEQRYRAVLEAEAGAPVTEVAARYGVTRQSVHAWVRRYRSGGLAALADRSHRPASCPHQIPAEIEAVVCELRRAHPRWGPARLAFELGKRDITLVPSEATLYRMLVRNGLIAPGQHRRPASSYIRWERAEPMELWQPGIMGGVFLANGTELKLVSGVDDHSRYCVIAQLVTRATSRAVCAAFAASLARFGVPGEVLSDNGKQFTGRFTRPRPSEVLFERICRENGITTRLTRPRTPTTTGKIERWHKTLRTEFLADHDSFASLAHAQAQLDAWVSHYNCERPHQSLGMATPASRFTTPAAADGQHQDLPLRLPPSLAALPGSPEPVTPPAAVTSTEPDAVEIDRIVPTSGNLFAARRQVWLGTALAGQKVTLRLDHTSLHVFHHGQLIKTHPATLTNRDLARLRAAGGRPGPHPPPPCHLGHCPPTPPSKSSGPSVAAAASASAASRSAPGSTWPGSASPCASTPSSSTSSPPAACWPVTTACAVTRLPRPRRSPPVRALQKVASRNTYGNAAPARDRSPNAVTSTSRSLQIRLTSLLLMPLSAPSAATRSPALRVEVPVT
jgi:transposase InsO family protein